MKERVESWLYDIGVDKNWTEQLLSEAEKLIKDLYAERVERNKAIEFQATIVKSLQETVDKERETGRYKNYRSKNFKQCC